MKIKKLIKSLIGFLPMKNTNTAFDEYVNTEMHNENFKEEYQSTRNELQSFPSYVKEYDENTKVTNHIVYDEQTKKVLGNFEIHDSELKKSTVDIEQKKLYNLIDNLREQGVLK